MATWARRPRLRQACACQWVADHRGREPLLAPGAGVSPSSTYISRSAPGWCSSTSRAGLSLLISASGARPLPGRRHRNGSRKDCDSRLGGTGPTALRGTAGDEAGASDAPASWPRILVVVDEVAKTTVRDLGDDRAARGAKQAATRRLGEIARLRRSVYLHLACCTQRPDADAVPGSWGPTTMARLPSGSEPRSTVSPPLGSDPACLLPRTPARRFRPTRPGRSSRRSPARWTRAGKCYSPGGVPGESHRPLALSHSGRKIHASTCRGNLSAPPRRPGDVWHMGRHQLRSPPQANSHRRCCARQWQVQQHTAKARCPLDEAGVQTNWIRHVPDRT